MSTLKTIKHETTKVIEKVKLKYQGQEVGEENESYKDSKRKYENIKSNLRNFIKMATEILTQFNQLMGTCGQISQAVAQAIPSQTTLEGLNLSDEFHSFAVSVQCIGNDNVSKQISEKVIIPMKQYLAEIEALEKLMKDHDENMLILTSNREKLNKLRSTGKVEKATEYEKKIETRSGRVVEIENNYNDAVEKLWIKRVEAVQTPILTLVTVFKNFVNTAHEKASSLRFAVGESVNNTNFPNGEIPQQQAQQKSFNMSSIKNTLGFK